MCCCPGLDGVNSQHCSRLSAHYTLNNKSDYMQNSTRQKGFTLVEIMIVVVIIGLLAAMAIPAFQKVRASSQDKAVLNNARQLSGAADQYYLEYGVNAVDSQYLLGVNSYVKNLQTAASEIYPTTYTQGMTITVTNVGNARTVTYAH